MNVKFRKIRKSRVLAAMGAVVLGLLAAAAGLVYFLGSDDFRVMAADNIVRAIEDRTGLETSLERFEIDFMDQGFAIDGLILRGEEDRADAPLLEIERVAVGLRWNALLFRQIDLTSLEIVRPRFRLEIGDNGQTNVPPPPERPAGEPPRFELAIGDLNVTGGQFSFDEERVDIDFRLSDVGGRFDYAEDTGILAGRLEWAGQVAWEDGLQIPYALGVDFDYTPGGVLVHGIEAVSGESRLELQGRIDSILPPFSGVLAYTGVADLAFMNHFFPDDEFEGGMELVGELDFSSTHFASSGRMRSPRLRFHEWTGSNVSSQYAYTFPDGVLTADNLEADAFGGRATGAVRVLPLPGPSRAELDLAYQDIDAALLRGFYPWGPDPVLDSSVSGTMAGWFRGRFDDFDLSGEAAFSPSEPTAPGAALHLPVAGTTFYRGRPGEVELQGMAGQLGATSLEASGLVGAEGVDLTVDLVSGDLTDLAFVDPRARGTGSFAGSIRGSWPRPDAAGRFTLEGYEFEVGGSGPLPIDRIAGRIELAGDVAALDAVRLDVGESHLVIDGEIDVRTLEPALDVEVDAVDVSEIADRMAVPAAGRLSGRLRVDSLAPIEASGLVQVAGLEYDGIGLGDAASDVTVNGDTVRLRNARLRQGPSTVTGDLEFDRATGALDSTLQASGHELAAFRWLGVPDALGGTVRTADFTIGGTPANPLIDGRAVIDDLRFREQAFDEAVVTVSTVDDADGSPLTAARIEMGSDLRIDVELDTFDDNYPFAGRAAFTRYDAAGIVGMAPGTVLVTGMARFDGELNDLESIDGEGEVAELRVFLDEEAIASPPFPFDFDAEEVRLSRVELAGEVTSMTIDGDVSLAADSEIDFAVNGDVNLTLLSSSVLSARFPNLETSGTLSISGSVVGTLANPELDGFAVLNSAAISHPDLFLGLSELNGDIQFTGDQINVFDVTGVAGGGAVTVGGAIGVEGIRPSRLDLQAEGRDIRVRTPQGLRAAFDASLSLRGTLESPALDGNADISSLSFEESFEEFLTLFGESSGGGLSADAGLFDALVLAVHVQGERGIRIENELARVDARLDLDIGGTLGQPTLTGRVESIDGVLDLQENRYLITRGTVDFVDPVGIEPRIDVQAETELRDYRVILTITGTGSDIQMAMSSDPPLPQLEIVSLMAGGRTREELAGASNAGAVPTSEELFQGAAATLVSDLLSERVGSRFGLGSLVRIDPFLVGAENDPAARITISEQVTRDLIVTYSQDLSSNRQEIILIEYFLNNRTSFIASRDETGAVGLDIRLRTRFR